MVGCETGKVLYVADSMVPVVGMTQAEWLGRPIYDLVHPEDVEKVRLDDFKEHRTMFCFGR